MDIDKEIEKLIKKFNEKIEELKIEYKRENNGKWIPKYGENFYYLDEELGVIEDWFASTEDDRRILKYNKIFETEEEAQEYADYLKARKEYSYEFSKEEWEDTRIDKYYIYYDYEDNNSGISSYSAYKYLNQIYFKSIEEAQEFIDKYKKQILKFEFDIEEEK